MISDPLTSQTPPAIINGYRVLAEYTDDSIRASSEGRSDPWAASRRRLLEVPAEWRQSVWAAAHRDAYRSEARPSYHDPRMLECHHVPTGISMDDAIQRRVGSFLAGQRPYRCETRVEG